MAEVLIGECLLHDAKGVTDAIRILRGKANVKNSRKYLYDLFLNDLHMPVADGLQLDE